MLEKLNKDIIDAMKSKDSFKLGTLRMLKGAAELERINRRVEKITDEDFYVIASKQIKTRKESIVEFEKGNRNDLVEQTKKEIETLNNYMLELLSEEEITKIIDDAIISTNSTSIKDMGNIMKEISGKVKGKADMSLVSEIIKNKLN